MVSPKVSGRGAGRLTGSRVEARLLRVPAERAVLEPAAARGVAFAERVRLAAGGGGGGGGSSSSSSSRRRSFGVGAIGIARCSHSLRMASSPASSCQRARRRCAA